MTMALLALRHVAGLTLGVALILGTPAGALAQDMDGQVSGVVVDASGQPLAGQRLELRRPSRDGAGHLVTTSDAMGQFSFTGLRAGRYEVEWRIEGRVVARSGPIELSPSAARATNVTLARPAPEPAFPPSREQVSGDQLLGGRPAPTSFDQLPSILERGHEVIVTDDAGHTIKGRISSISSNRLVLVRRRFRFSTPEEWIFAGESVRTIRFVDSPWNGTLIGAGVVAGVVAVLTEIECSRSCDDNFGRAGRWVIGNASYLPVGILIGHEIDLLMNKAVYERAGQARVMVSPLIGRDRRGVMARILF